MAKQFTYRDVDWTLMIIVLIVCGVGVLQIYSATMDTDFHSAWWRQVLFIVSGIGLMYGAMKVDYHSLTQYALPGFYAAAVVALRAGGLGQ